MIIGKNLTADAADEEKLYRGFSRIVADQKHQGFRI
jgi:hypothetical protein